MILKKTGLFLLLAGFGIGCNNQSPSANNNIEFSQNNGGITLPDGFQAVVVADSVGEARHITVSSDGAIYVMLGESDNGKGIVALQDTNNDGKADQTEYFGNISGTGIQLHNGYLYASSDTSIVRFAMTEEELVPASDPEVIVRGFPEQNQHSSKPFTFDSAGHMYVTVGGPSNACQEQTRTPGSPGQDPCPQLELHGGIWQFSATTPGQSQQDDGYRYATGIRNAVALDWNTQVNRLYALQHGRDQLYQLWPEHFNEEESAELPAEEFLLIEEGLNFGWPYTYYDWQKDERMVAPEYGGDGEEVAEGSTYDDPIMAFPGHWAPNDLIFYTADQFPQKYRNGAFIAFHGSWNRAPLPQEGYSIVFVPFEGETPSGDYEIFADGFKGTETLDSPGNAEYRPMGLALGPDGSLYITDSEQGKIWRVMYTGS